MARGSSASRNCKTCQPATRAPTPSFGAFGFSGSGPGAPTSMMARWSVDLGGLTAAATPFGQFIRPRFCLNFLTDEVNSWHSWRRLTTGRQRQTVQTQRQTSAVSWPRSSFLYDLDNEQEQEHEDPEPELEPKRKPEPERSKEAAAISDSQPPPALGEPEGEPPRVHRRGCPPILPPAGTAAVEPATSATRG